MLLAIAAVGLFGTVAVAATGVPSRSAEQASAARGPRYTPIPVTEAVLPSDVGEHRARNDARLRGRFVAPLEGALVLDDPDLLPGAPRDYRAGVHEGIDFPAESGTPVHAAAGGTVVRIDASFVDWTNDEQEVALSEAVALGYTPAGTLERIRGRQVWIDHGGGIVTRYAHLSSVALLAVGERVHAGDVVGEVGSSGFPQGGPHLHFEVRVGDDYFGDGLSGDLLVRAVARLFR